MKLKPCLLIALLLTATATAFAQGTFSFTPSSLGPIQYLPNPATYTGVSTQSVTFPTPAASLANYNAMQVTYSAPAGYAWLVNVAGHPNNYILDASVSYSSPGTDYHQTADYSFSFVPVMAGSVASAIITQRLSEQSFGFDAQFQFTGNVEFTSLTVTLHYVPGHDWQVAQRPLSPFYQAGLAVIPSYYGPTDGQQDLFLVPTPEPGVASLSILGAGLAVLLRPSLRGVGGAA